MGKKKIHIGVRILAWLVTLPVLVLGVGWIFHTSFDPAVFGKYSGPYFTFLLCWWLLVTPAVYFFARFVFDTQRIELTSGRVLHVRPSLKILLTLIFGVIMTYAVQYRISKALGHGVTTPQKTDVFHPYLQNVPKQQTKVEVNYWGFRGHQIDRVKPAGTYRIFALGGSTTFSGPLKLADTYPELLATKLREAHPNRAIEVQNAAAEWHSSQHSLIKFLTWVRAFDPDLILVFHAINDLGRSLSPTLFSKGTYREDYGHFLGPVSNLVRKDTTWPFVRMRFGHWFSDFLRHKVRVHGPTGDGLNGIEEIFFDKADPTDVTEWPSLEAYERNMVDLVRAARRAGVQVVLASQPFLYRADLTAAERARLWTPISHQFDGKRASLKSMIEGMSTFNAATARIAREQGAGFVDLDAVVPRTTEYLWDDVHHTKKATEKIAAAFLDHIEREKLLDK